MKLNHPGIYRIIGENFEILANVVGEVPCLRVTSALHMNALIQKGKFIVLTEESAEIQQFYGNPEKFVCFEYEYSEICKLPHEKQTLRGVKMPDISDSQYTAFTNRYLEDMNTPGRGINATKFYIVETTGWSLAQVQVVMLQIAKKLRVHGYLLFD